MSIGTVDPRRTKTQQANQGQFLGHIDIKSDKPTPSTIDPFTQINDAIFPELTGLMTNPRVKHIDSKVSSDARYFYCYLKYLWDCLGRPKKFYRTDEQISIDLQWSKNKIRNLKKELNQAQVIDYWRESIQKGNKQTVTYYKFFKGF